MSNNAEKKQVIKKEAEKESYIMKSEQLEQNRKLQQIKQEKLRELDQLGIPDKFKVDLNKKKIT